MNGNGFVCMMMFIFIYSLEFVDVFGSKGMDVFVGVLKLVKDFVMFFVVGFCYFVFVWYYICVY